MGQERNKQTIWGLWKHSVEQEKDICIQQSQNKSTLLKTLYCRIQGKEKPKNLREAVPLVRIHDLYERGTYIK